MAEVQEQFKQATEQPQPKKANWWKRGVLIVAGGFVLTIGGCEILVGALAVGSSGGASDTSESQAKPKPTYNVGDTAKAGKMTWTVTNAYETDKLIDSYDVDPPKRGHFVITEFEFTNGSNEAVTLDAEMHVALKDAKNREFSPSAETTGYIPMRKDIWLTEVNPGVTQKGMAIFTTAPDAQDFTFVADDVEMWEEDSAKFDLGF
jgi:Domain of unknown function (DUF4352)